MLLRGADRAAIGNLEAWLTRVLARICLDLLGSARARREEYVGQWLPEPVLGGLPVADPADRVTLDETVGMALLVVLETLTPAERTAFVLHDEFGLAFDEIAEVVGRTPAGVRKLASRAVEAFLREAAVVISPPWSSCWTGRGVALRCGRATRSAARLRVSGPQRRSRCLRSQGIQHPAPALRR